MGGCLWMWSCSTKVWICIGLRVRSRLWTITDGNIRYQSTTHTQNAQQDNDPWISGNGNYLHITTVGGALWCEQVKQLIGTGMPCLWLLGTGANLIGFVSDRERDWAAMEKEKWTNWGKPRTAFGSFTNWHLAMEQLQRQSRGEERDSGVELEAWRIGAKANDDRGELWIHEHNDPFFTRKH